MTDLAPVRALTWDEMPPGWRWATVGSLLLAVLFVFMYMKVLSLESMNTRLQVWSG